MITFGRGAVRAAVLGAPLLVVAALFQTGYMGAAGAALLLLPVGLYHAVRGLVVGQAPGQLLFGVFLLFEGVIGDAAVADRDARVVHKKEAASSRI